MGTLASALVAAAALAVIQAAINMRASDIHIEPFEHLIRVRFRIDGVLIKYGVLPAQKRKEISAIVKVMAALDSTRNREAQDGKIKYEYGGNFIVDSKAF